MNNELDTAAAMVATSQLIETSDFQLKKADCKIAENFTEAFGNGYIRDKIIYTFVKEWCLLVNQSLEKGTNNEETLKKYLSEILRTFLGFQPQNSTNPYRNQLEQHFQDARRIIIYAMEDAHPTLRKIVLGGRLL